MILGAAIISVLWIRATSPNRPFDAELWRMESSTLESSDLRQHMVNDLQQNVLSRGMSRADVNSLLGKPDPGFFSDSHDLAYRLGRDSDTGTVTRHGSVVSSSGRESWLTLNFNDRDRLVEWRIVKR